MLLLVVVRVLLLFLRCRPALNLRAHDAVQSNADRIGHQRGAGMAIVMITVAVAVTNHIRICIRIPIVYVVADVGVVSVVGAESREIESIASLLACRGRG